MQAQKTADELRALIDAIRQTLQHVTLERETTIDAMLRAAIAGRHMLLLGEPGTAKSFVVEAFAALLSDATTFTYLLTKHTEPAEIFGPIDVRAMADTGALRRRTMGFLPQASIVFLDECFKASSAILNTMLRVLNERQMFDDGKMVRLPLRFAMLASNEVPSVNDHSVGAFYDRILVRLQVHPVERAESFVSLMRDSLPAPSTTIASMSDIDEAGVMARDVTISDSAMLALATLRAEVRDIGIIVSDRRWREIGGYLRAHAWLQNSATVEVHHLGVVVDCLWSRVDDIPRVQEIVGRIAPTWDKHVAHIRRVLSEQRDQITRAAGLPKDAAMASLGEVSRVLDDVAEDVRLTVLPVAPATIGGVLAEEVKSLCDQAIQQMSEAMRRRT